MCSVWLLAEVEVEEMRVQTAKKLFKSAKSSFSELIVGLLVESSLKQLKRQHKTYIDLPLPLTND